MSAHLKSLAARALHRRTGYTPRRTAAHPGLGCSEGPALTHRRAAEVPHTCRPAYYARRHAHASAARPPQTHSSSTRFTSEDPPRPPPPRRSESESGHGNSISDHEWNLRAGRAVYTLRTTLPTFFETGLISSVDHDPDPDPDPPPEAHSPKREECESIYAPNIRLSYTPPATLSLPSPFPKTLQVEGLPLYYASSTFIRHTLSALNTQLRVEVCRLQVRSSGARHRAIVIRTIVSGESRLSGMRHEWDVHSTYTLSPESGMIDLHVFESIHPAPHIAFYNGLRAAIERLVGGERQASEGVRGCVRVSDRRLVPIQMQEGERTNRDLRSHGRW